MKVKIVNTNRILSVLCRTKHMILEDGDSVYSFKGGYILNPLVEVIKKEDYEEIILKVEHERELGDVNISKDSMKCTERIWCHEWVQDVLVENNMNLNKKENKIMRKTVHTSLKMLFVILSAGAILIHLGHKWGEPNTIEQCGLLFNRDLIY